MDEAQVGELVEMAGGEVYADLGEGVFQGVVGVGVGLFLGAGVRGHPQDQEGFVSAGAGGGGEGQFVHDQAWLGRHLGWGLNTKVHLASDAQARPLAIVVTAGQSGDAPAFTAVMNAIRVPPLGPGRSRTRPDIVIADGAYSARAIRTHLRERSIRAVIPQPADQVRNRLRRGVRGGRPPGFDPETYELRNTV
ncbi:IS4/IS5 family transposase [Streptomyces sp. WAC07149]|nr:IS4/IS5 family transposase [Streptomyces sp. WAC07149]